VLQNKVEGLERQLNQNSRNSHRPPSSEGFKKQPAIPRQKHKKGGQPGHRGNTLKMVNTPDVIIELKPDVCRSCQHKLDDKRTDYTIVSRRQTLDIPPMILQSTEYQRYGCTCGHCGAYNQGTYPKGVNAPIQYGSGVKALVTLLHQNGCLSVEKIQTLFSDLFSAPLNEATILQCQHTAYEKLEAEEQYIKAQLLAGKVCHADESGLRVEGANHWLHTLGNTHYTYQFVHRKRGQAAHEPHLSVLHQYRGWLIHDCYPFYFRFTQAKHGACNAHVIRELQEQAEAGRSWAKRFRKYLLSLYKKTDQGTQKLSKKEQKKALSKYRQLLKAGYKEEPSPQPQPNGIGRPKNTKGRNLLLRLDEKQEAILAFAWHQCVPFTNNLAERDIRPAKTKLKVAGCFRTLKGARIYARINSVIATIRKQKLNPFNELLEIFNGNLPSYRLATT
jgi:transposase